MCDHSEILPTERDTAVLQFDPAPVYVLYTN